MRNVGTLGAELASEGEAGWEFARSSHGLRGKRSG